jgi:type I restriction enzyme S subunit
MTAIRPKNAEESGAFLVAALRSKPVRGEIGLNTDSGTVMDALNVKNIPTLRLPRASDVERRAFQEVAGPLLVAADVLRDEISALAATKEELLPLLMSGRVRVKDVAA